MAGTMGVGANGGAHHGQAPWVWCGCHQVSHAINPQMSMPQLWSLPCAGTMGVGATKLTHAFNHQLNQIPKGRHTSLWIDVIKPMQKSSSHTIMDSGTMPHAPSLAWATCHFYRVTHSYHQSPNHAHAWAPRWHPSNYSLLVHLSTTYGAT